MVQIHTFDTDWAIPPKAAENIKQLVGDGMPSGQIPIFATLAEAEAYEAANPGKQALTIESTEPDTTPPAAGLLSIAQLGGTYVEAKVTGASDDRGVVEYEFSLDGVAQPWQAEDRYMWTGLALESAHTVTYRVRDRAGNLRSGMSLPVTTLAADPEPQWGTRWHDDFTGDGLLEGRSMDSGSGVWAGRQREGDALWSTSGGLVKYVQADERYISPISGYASLQGLRGFAATVPAQASSRVRITLVANRSSQWATLGPIMQSTAGDRWLVGMESNAGTTNSMWHLPAGATAAVRQDALPELGAPYATATYVYDFTPGNLTISINGKEVASVATEFDLTAAAHWGFYYGRNSNNGVHGSVDSFTIRWE